jgi:hypothetical protein
MDDKGKYSYNYLISKGLTPVAAAGIVGNLVAESGLDTKVKGTADDKGSVGIAQWHSERKEGLMNFAKNQGKNYDSLSLQLDYILHELKQPEYKDTFSNLQLAKTPAESTNIFMNKYERPAEWAKKKSIGLRVGSANEILTGEPYKNVDYIGKDYTGAGGGYEGITPEQQAYFDAQVAKYSGIKAAEESKEDAEAEKAKAVIAQKQQEQAFKEEMKQRTEQAPQREQEQQAPQFDGSAYRLEQQQMPTLQYEQIPVTEYKSGGYVVTRSQDRQGKTHKVTGPDGTVKYFGDSKLGQHPNDPKRKAAFYARHKHNLDSNPYFRAFARTTWQDGGEIKGEVKCSNCGWKWDKSESSSQDMYNCHRCGGESTGNTVMQKGGKIEANLSVRDNIPNFTSKKIIPNQVPVKDDYQDNIMDFIGVNKFRDSVYDEAYKRGVEGDHNGGLDALRHSSSAAKVSSMLPMGPGMIAANVMGALHEVNPDSVWKETKSDLYNNFIGSAIGSIPFLNDKQRQVLLLEAQKRGILSDLSTGKKLPKKENGGEIEGRRYNPNKKQRANIGYFAEGGTLMTDEYDNSTDEIDPIKKPPTDYREVPRGSVRDAIPSLGNERQLLEIKKPLIQPRVTPITYIEKGESNLVVRDVVPSFSSKKLEKELADKKVQANLDVQTKQKMAELKKINPNINKAVDMLSVMETQKKLYELGYDLGHYGKDKTGIDGIMGTKTKQALAEYNKTKGPAQGNLSLEQEERITRLKKPESTVAVKATNYLTDKTEQLVDTGKELISKVLPYNIQYNPELDTVGAGNTIKGGHKYLLDNKSLADIRKEKNISFLQITKNRGEGNTVLPLQLKDRMVNSTNPQGYKPDYEIDDKGEVTLPFFDRLKSEESKTGQVVRLPGVKGDRREDIYRMYSGLPQKYDTFTASSFKAGKDSDTNLTFKNPEDVADYVKIAATHTDLFKKLANGEITPETIAKDKLSGKKGGDKINKAGFKDPKNVMWNATFGVDFDKKGNPYLSFYDNWDLKGKDDLAVSKVGFGSPIEIYDRIPLSQELIKHLSKLSSKADDLSASDAVPTDDKSFAALTKKIAETPAAKREYEKLLSQIKQRYK